MDCRGWFLVFGRSENGLIHPHLSPSRLVVQVQCNLPKLAPPGARTYLTSALLAFGVYEKVGQRARERAKLAAEHMRNAQRERGELGAATDEAETSAAARFEALTGLARTVDDKLAALAQLRVQAEQAAQQARTVRDEADLLAALQTPAEVPGLARRIAEADDLIAERRKRQDDAEQLEADAERARDALPDKTRIETFRTASSPHKDPRAPQNLVPIGGLERELRHRLGDQQLLYRSLRAAAATWPAPTKTRPWARRPGAGL